MRLSVRTKVLLVVSLSLVLIFAIIMYLLVVKNTNSLRSNLNQQSKSFAALATKPIGNTFLLYKDSGTLKITEQVDSFLSLDPDVKAIRVVSVDGHQLFSSNSAHYPSVPENLASTFQTQYQKNSKGYIQEIVQPFIEESGVHRYAIVYEISSKRAEQNVADTIQLILYTGVIILVISIIATGFMLNRLFIRPLRAVSRSANIISAGDFDHQIKAGHNDEISDLAASVNRMAEYLKADIIKLRDLDKLKSEFMMIASHNLRTPITIMRGYIDVAQSAQTVEELKSIVQTISDSIVRLHLLAEDVLTISTLEAGDTTMRKSPVPMKTFIDSIGEEFGVLAKEKKLEWEFANDIPDSANMAINQANIRSALGNLLDNAIKFTKENGHVGVKSRLSGDQFVFEVSDSGIGISPSEMPKLFTKFHRGTSTETYDYEGVGIGLYLTKLIVEQHGGKIDIKSVEGQGSTFTVTLPLKTGDAPSTPSAPGDHPPAA